MRTSNLLPISILLLLAGMASFSGLSAQGYQLRGQVSDTAQNALPGITAAAYALDDPTLAFGDLTDEAGRFVIQLQTPGRFRVVIHSPGFQPFRDTLNFTGTDPRQDLGQIILGPLMYDADSVQIEAEQTPMLIKGDTIEFNASSFGTRPNATLEKLLEQLPGVEVAEDGTITAEGQPVQKITIDGKEFFGNNVQLAAKNLPSDFISKIQITDSKNRESEFTGIDDGERLKSINLKLKPEKRSGNFGNVSGGYGIPDDRYVGKANAFRFSSRMQLSLLGLVNNVNEIGFGWDQIRQFMGGYQNMGSVDWGGGAARIGGAGVGLPLSWGNDDGFITTKAGGLNFNYDLSDQTQLTVTYLYGGANTLRQETSYRENFLTDDRFITTDTSTQTRQTDGHAFNMMLRHNLDSLSEIEVQGAGSWSTEVNENTAINRSLNGLGNQLNSSERSTFRQQESLQGRGSFRYRRKFRKEGRNLYTGLDGSIGDQDQSDDLRSANRYFDKTGAETDSDTLRQEQLTAGKEARYSVYAGYNEPLSKHGYLTLSVNRSVDAEENERDAFDLGERFETGRNRNVELTNHFRRTQSRNRYRFGYRHEDKHLRMRATLSGEQTRLNNEYLSADTVIDQRFFFFLPEIDLRYQWDNEVRFDIEYQTSVREPSLRQLQPFVDNTNPLRLYQGNPSLQPTYQHEAEIELRQYQRRSQKGWRISMEGGYYQNDITTRKTVDSLLRQITQPVNIDQSYRMQLYGRYRHPLPFLRSEISLRSDLEYFRNTVFLNEVAAPVDRFSESFRLRFSNRDRQVFGYQLEAEWEWVQNQFVNQAAFNRSFLNQSYELELDLNLSQRWAVSTDLDVRLFGGDAFDKAQVLPLWGAEVRSYPLKDGRLEVKLSATDLLNRNLGFNRRTTDTFLEEEQVTSLARYFLLTATWQLSAMSVDKGRREFD